LGFLVRVRFNFGLILRNLASFIADFGFIKNYYFLKGES
jgi:hypothetical protein